MGQDHPLRLLEGWIGEAESAGVTHPASAAFVTSTTAGAPSARTVTLKRLEPEALIFTSALWTRKARELAENPQVALLFHWPSMGRQVHVSAKAELGSRELSEELFDERDVSHRWQTVVSRQGDEIECLDPLRDRLAHLLAASEAPPACPDNWGAIRVRPFAVELWEESPDRLHRRRMFVRDRGAWTERLLAP